MASDFNNSTKQKLLPLAAIQPTGGSGQIRDLSPTWWFSPLQPSRPVAPSSYRPRQYAYTPGTNILWMPKGDDAITYQTLRSLADSWDLLDIVIRTQLDRLCSSKFEVRAKIDPDETKEKHAERNAEDEVVLKLNEFLAYPDGIHAFSDWLRMWLEDMIVIDAVALYLERDQKGKIASIHPIAGDTINRCLTEQGFVPSPPDVAYQQVVYGSVACDLTTDDLIFYMRNERTNRRYGHSPVEQILITISIALRRQEFQLQYYTSGNMPEALCFLPSDMPVDKVQEVQEWFDSVMAGDLAKRRRLTFLPGYGTSETRFNPNVVFPKEPLLKDEMDEWLAKVACFCIGISPQPFIKQMNRATAQQAQETSEYESQEPYLLSIENILNNIVQRKMGYAKYEVVRQKHEELDVLKQAQADVLLCPKIYTVNQILERRGEDKREEPEADMLGEYTVSGFIPLHAEDHLSRQETLGVDPQTKHDQAIESMAAKPDIVTGGKPNGKGKPNGVGKFRHHGPLRQPPRIKAGLLTHTNQSAREFVHKTLKSVFDRMAHKAADAVLKLTKADDVDSVTEAVMKALEGDLSAIPAELQQALETAAHSGMTQGLLQIDINDTGVITRVNEIAKQWARNRAAEMVGMKYNVKGKLVTNPKAEWATTDSTREGIREVVERSFSAEELSRQDVVDLINKSGIFSDSRAEMIANTEISRAQVEGNLEIWRESGVVGTVDWITSEDEVCDECEALADESPYDIEDAPVPIDDSHPNCQCILSANAVEE